MLTVIKMADLFPHLTEAQISAIFKGQPVPPSPNWVPPSDWQPPVPRSPSGELLSPAVTAGRPQLTGSEDVIAVMAISDHTRSFLAVSAIAAFRRQTWPYRRLVVVNATQSPLLKEDVPGVEEIMTYAATPATMKNIGLTRYPNRWWLPWDDDDFHHPQLLHILAGNRADNRVVTPDATVRVNIDAGLAHQIYGAGGVPSVCLYPPAARYREDRPFGEDIALFESFPVDSRTVLPAHNRPAALCRVSYFHGKNASPSRLFFAPPPGGRSDPLPPELIPLLQQAGRSHGLRIQGDATVVA